MRTIVWSNAFTRSLKRWMRKHPFAPQLETHKLKGKLSGSWACSAGYDLRIVFDFVKAEKDSVGNILLLAIGTHDEVY